MLHEKLEEYNSAFEKSMEELEEPEMPEDPKSSAPSTTDETPKKSREQYQKPTDKDIKNLLYLYFIRGLTIEKASKIILALLSYNCSARIKKLSAMYPSANSKRGGANSDGNGSKFRWQWEQIQLAMDTNSISMEANQMSMSSN
ncbi:hypothetical protein PHYBLDRAFT_73579 [Phycomyces blakesleeanus NRRL 1555(-)]|uniref:Uncharacterized protein n=1 Tax=Phycomyces blakesleeanus (strain ATCC 8743b / DSM 1359 / FGSC 10004 / NBRC 33097 / NRRL 1555) TaxID=763407 RepID=A0A167PKV5_PHYB8|nr:hypothetical protein PHYBLDRAFT_73579 [Phycomyces blakesleeanus NRRL 1555(-)]OAD78138.1 hypothetical protein PHYBLDRAFT_73579 [Phycomyces blakesleeanus NRRL 1555(-)]|eukprot:XP_018296178.1 hypothetical protein PHYBLDRAFT_73579 [Phycomyces blakesleeanus NRRL 1555(-)]